MRWFKLEIPHHERLSLSKYDAVFKLDQHIWQYPKKNPPDVIIYLCLDLG